MRSIPSAWAIDDPAHGSALNGLNTFSPGRLKSRSFRVAIVKLGPPVDAREDSRGTEGGRSRRPLERRASSVSRGTDAERRNPRQVRDDSADLPH